MLSTELKNAQKVQKQIEALATSPAEAKRLYQQAGRELMKATRQRLRAQQTISGSAFAPRKRGNKKVLRGMGKGLVFYANPNGVTVTWKSPVAGKIARQHQEGFSEDYTATKAKKIAQRRGEPDYSAAATKKQADALIKQGYKRPVGGVVKSGKRKGAARTARVSKKWVMENMTVGQAGLVLRTLRDKEPVESWEVKVPARPFFGMTEKDQKNIINKIVNHKLKKR